jgi:hypothetical protein
VVETKYSSLRGGCYVLSKFVRYEVGDGSKVRFWHNLWCGEQLSKISYPILFSIARCEDLLVDHMQFQNGNLHWNILIGRWKWSLLSLSYCILT